MQVWPDVPAESCQKNMVTSHKHPRVVATGWRLGERKMVLECRELLCMA